MIYSHALSRAWRRLHVFVGLLASVVVGHINHFGFGFTTL